jgi:hypothetical protein
MMKKICISLLSVFLFLSCDKEDDAEPDNSTLLTTGFICTVGINSIDDTDTLALRAGNSGTFTITDYSHTAEKGGFLERPKDIWTLETSGDNNWYLKNNAGKYIDFSYDFYDPINEQPEKYGYRYDLSDSPTEKSTLIRSRSGNGFYLESLHERGYYLSTFPADVQPPDPSHRNVRFSTKKQVWFFMP